ncbi:MAG: lytic transglycosylase F [Odoribacter sp.]|nr:lytic transglycosylase F [Odoribacter sp.]
MRERGKLIAVTDFNSTNYFIYKGEPMGFHYELLKQFSEYLSLNLEIITENDINKAFEMLNTGKTDLLAFELTINSSRRKEIRFTEPISQTRQVLVQRKPGRWRSMTIDDIEKNLLRNQLELAGKTVYVQVGASSFECLKNLEDEIGDTLGIIEVPFETEELISMVAHGDIDYAVCDENIALVNTGYFPVIDVATPVSFLQHLAWGIRKEKSDKLASALNGWITTFKKTDTYALLYAKYFRNDRSNRIFHSDYYSIGTGKVSPWDNLIKSFSDSINWDWRLLASLIYQESRFDPEVISWAGAIGLMQIMPETGRHFGIDIMSSPENNMKAGVLYINYLQEFFSDRIPDSTERLKFVLAAYNAGAGNIVDAMKLAEKNGKNPLLWDENVAVYLLKKSEPKYYNDPVVENGYCRGDESVNFVSQVLERYAEYKNIIPLQKNPPF